MLSKAKAYYQVYLIIEHLPKEEYDLIPKELIDEIENNMEYDETFSLDLNVPLEKQKIDDKAYEILDRVVKATEVKQKEKKEQKQFTSSEIDTYLKQVEESNENYNTRIENIRLKNLVETLKKENGKIPKAKDLLTEYKDVLKQKEVEIEKLKKNNEDLYHCIQKIPKFLRKIFIKNEEVKLLGDN